MSKLLFKLRGVPDDEADEIRALLTEKQIEYYETSAGNWGISLPALWLQDDSRYSEAKELLDAYQIARTQRIRAEYARLKQAGKQKTLRDSFLENPLVFAGYIFIVIVLLYLPVKIVVELGKW
ncbi:MAG: DUF6164 family protein [Nitrosomonas sp.]|jgi:hypothetical protein|nr:hypothetical protein [Nitrosomonas sp.]MCC7136173.1 hypothetical protein [Nitrosomonas sp.]